MEFIRKKREKRGIDIAPLVDIIFLLLIFFMISSNFIKPNIKMELPKALFEQKLEKVDIIVSVSRDEEIYINKEKILINDLGLKLSERMNSLEKYDVIFRGDSNIQYNLFVEILDIAKLAGAVSFSIEHEK